MRIYQRGKIWYIDYTSQGKRYRKRIGYSKKVAELTLMDIQLKIEKQVHLGIQSDEKVLFNDYAQQYQEYARTNKSPSTYRSNKLSIKVLTKTLGNIYLGGITPQDIEKFKADRLNGHMASTTNRDLACLKNMFNKAIEWGMIQRNPMKAVKLLKEPPGRLRFLSEEEIERLLKELPLGARTIVSMAMYTGLRRGEILNLKWSNVDLKNRMIIVEKTKTNDRRIIPINDKLHEQLIALSASRKGELVFAQQMVNLRKRFEEARKRANIKDFRFHDLRHTFASYLVMSGANIRVVQQLLGHKDIKMTMRYSHLSQDHLQNAVNQLNFTKQE